MRRSNGRWVQMRQAEPQEWAALGNLADTWAEHLPQSEIAEQADSLALIARDRAVPVGWLSLVRGESEGEADLTFGIDPAYQGPAGEDHEGTGIGALLLECALDWARAQPGLERLCVQVRADNLPVSRLCCRYGFDGPDPRQGRDSPRSRAARAPDISEQGSAGWIQLDCSL